MKRILFLVLITFTTIFSSRADEGMWIPLFLGKNEADMQKLGMKISAKDIYDINHASLKDAIVQFGPGCTGEFVSEKGLLLTNHHCGYSEIVKHSTVEHDYLTNGFWSKNLSQELPCPGLKATLLVRMEDVTTQVLEGVTNQMSTAERAKKIEANIKKIKEKTAEGTHYQINIAPFYYGNQYFMYVNEVFEDVRFVGAPPSNIGKFGGDTDNWMWPRHTGDFSVFRVYASPDNQPAAYSAQNVPYKPKKNLSISLKGFTENDFTFVFGYPGRTQQFLTSQAVDLTVNTYNPARIMLREKRLEIYNTAMRQSAAQRLRYSAQVASIANFWKKMIGESRGITRLKGVEKKREFEAQFTEWVNQSPERKAQYGNLFTAFDSIYKQLRDIELNRLYFSEAILASEAMQQAYTCYLSANTPTDEFGIRHFRYQKWNDSVATEIGKDMWRKLKPYYENYTVEQRAVDKQIFQEIFALYYNNYNSLNTKPNSSSRLLIMNTIQTKFKGDVNAYTNQIFENSIFTSKEKIEKTFAKFKKIKDYLKLTGDPMYHLMSIMDEQLCFEYPITRLQDYNRQLDSLYRIYVAGMMEMQKDRRFFPDANSTLRIAYGKVQGFEPEDGIDYKYYTTIEGIMQKENPNIYDYVVEPKLKELYNNKDYGRYASKTGEMNVAFIATNHTTGGNSGSPVLNANGELIGINFDRCWESTMSDLMYDPSQCRNIALDIRYCLFIIDKFAGASNLIDEMAIVK